MKRMVPGGNWPNVDVEAIIMRSGCCKIYHNPLKISLDSIASFCRFEKMSRHVGAFFKLVHMVPIWLAGVGGGSVWLVLA